MSLYQRLIYGCLFGVKVVDYLWRVVKIFINSVHDYLSEKLLISQTDTFQNIEKLNLGCGKYHVDGWLNIGLFKWSLYPENFVVEKDGDAMVLNADVNNVESIYLGKIKYIYSSHLIEHLEYGQAIKLLENCFKGLRKGGVIRISCPDLQLWIEKYQENDLNFFEKYKSLY